MYSLFPRLKERSWQSAGTLSWAAIFDIIRTVNQQGITVLLNEQNANMALKVADYAYVLETGPTLHGC